jgi:transposase
MIDHLDRQLEPLDHRLIAFARRQPGCRALQQLFGVGEITAVAILAELGDCRRFQGSDDAVRHTGLDVTVWSSDGRRAPGHLARQGPELLRWALFEAAQSAARTGSPDHAYYLEVRGRIDHNRACLSVARKLCRRAHHILRELGDDALAPTDPPGAELVEAAA